MGLLLFPFEKRNKSSGLVVPAAMRHEIVTTPAERGTKPAFHIDWKALGYIVSIVSVFFLGAIAWPKPEDPGWHLPALIIGMVTSVIGMGFRYKAHLDEKREIRKAEEKADHADGRASSSKRRPARPASPASGRR